MELEEVIVMLERKMKAEEKRKNTTTTTTNMMTSFNKDGKEIDYELKCERCGAVIGYQYSDKEFFVSIFNNKQALLAIILAAIISICLVLTFIRMKQNHSIATLTFFIAIFCIVGLWAFNGGVQRELGIVKGDGALLMNAPSAGGKKLVELVPGERFKIKGESDIWYKVVLPNEEEGYIRKGRVFDVK